MNIKQSAAIVGSLALVLGAGMVSAANGPGQGRGDHRPGPPEEVRQAIENNDFAAWQAAVSGKGPLADHATQEVFDTMVEMHTLHESGDLEGAKALHESLANELGIEFKQHRGAPMMGGPRPQGSPEERAALEAGDYDAWKTAVEASDKGPFVDNASKEVFATLQEMHTLHESGDHEAAKELHEDLFDDLGIEMPDHEGEHHRFEKFRHHDHDDYDDDGEEDDD